MVCVSSSFFLSLFVSFSVRLYVCISLYGTVQPQSEVPPFEQLFSVWAMVCVCVFLFLVYVCMCVLTGQCSHRVRCRLSNKVLGHGVCVCPLSLSLCVCMSVCMCISV